MKLTNEQLRTTIHGAVEIQEQNGRLVPIRFGKFVREQVYVSGDYHNKCFHTAGVFSEFLTDSQHLSFKTNHSHFDVLVDGNLHFRAMREGGRGEFSLSLPEGKKRITIYYHFATQAQLWDVELDDGACFEQAPKRERKILFLGDSITHGYSASFSSMTYASRVTETLYAEAINQGIGGEKLNPYAIDEQLPFTPDLVSVAYGTNDWASAIGSHSRLAGTAAGYYARLRDLYPNAAIVCILPLWRGDSNRETGVGSFEEARRLIRAAAERVDAYIVDGMELVPHVPGVYRDGYLHPDNLGFAFYAENLVPHFKRALERK